MLSLLLICCLIIYSGLTRFGKLIISEGFTLQTSVSLVVNVGPLCPQAGLLIVDLRGMRESCLDKNELFLS